MEKLKGWAIFLILTSATLVVLKLSEAIDWTWVEVTAPLWVPVAVVAEIILALILTKIIGF